MPLALSAILVLRSRRPLSSTDLQVRDTRYRETHTRESQATVQTFPLFQPNTYATLYV